MNTLTSAGQPAEAQTATAGQTDGFQPAAALRANAQYGIQYLLHHIREDGSFVYEQNARTGTISDTYNILRHAGCLYVLYQCAGSQLVAPSGALPRLEKATAYLLNQMKPVKDHPESSAVLEENIAKLGGAALTLIALIERHRLQPEASKLVIMRKLASFLCWMQQPSGKFHCKYDNKRGVFRPFESGYYPGQAVLALVSLYGIDPDTRWLQAAEAGARWLLQNPVLEAGRKVNNHWFAIAITKLYFINHEEELYRELGEQAAICIQEIERRLPATDRQPADAPAEALAVAPADAPADAPAVVAAPHYASAWATFGETLVAAIRVERRLDHPERVETLLPYARKLIDACLQLQIRFKDPAYRYYTVGGIRENEKTGKVRIDFVQHVLAVILGLLEA